ncbi:lipocalin family protein [Flavobacterium sp. AS60]|uniref:lipocalin family protein n=1 Tax=Flavobacterium anseongense TaxID=2910677 RepID=UPI001F35C5D0|nr:lipocalin family protein [Flavobacterium sp. AS60]MCF6129698.1 lipocalin family protein [Flavobacterium sp. AS60]
MKKIKLAILAILSGFMFSCSSDDGPTTSGELTGKWYYKEYLVAGETIPYDDHEVCGKDYIQFNADGTGLNVDVWSCTEDVAFFTYTRSGNNITVTSDGQSDTARITELSSTTLKVKVTYDFDGDGDDESVIEVFTKS